jgi:hypothetical protein
MTELGPDSTSEFSSFPSDSLEELPASLHRSVTLTPSDTAGTETLPSKTKFFPLKCPPSGYASRYRWIPPYGWNKGGDRKGREREEERKIEKRTDRR